MTTFPAQPAEIRLSHAPRCTSLPYRLSVRAKDVELHIVNAAGHKVWDADREHTCIAAGRSSAFTWCGQAEDGGKVTSGRYRGRIEAEQAGSNAKGQSTWRTTRVSR